MSESLAELSPENGVREAQGGAGALVKWQVRVVEIQRPPAHGEDVQRDDESRVACGLGTPEDRARDVLVDRLRPVELEPADAWPAARRRVLRRGNCFRVFRCERRQDVRYSQRPSRAGYAALSVAVQNSLDF